MSAPLATEKVWGTTAALLVTPLFEMHRLRIMPRHRCSMHIHRFKHNAFYVLSGELFIDTEIDITNVGHCSKDTCRLLVGDTYTVAPGVRHQFRTGLSPCVALEMYFTEPLSEDIIRSNVGGPA